jgi:hypothetical protein
VAEELLDFANILSYMVKEDCGGGMPQPMGGDLPHPERPASCPEPEVERAVGERLTRIGGLILENGFFKSQCR